MKIPGPQETLAKGLAVVGRAVGARSTLPQASHVLLASDEGRLKLVATNLDIAITCWIGAPVEEEGAITIPPAPRPPPPAAGLGAPPAPAATTRPVLTGIHTLLEDSELSLAAADGFRLAVYKLALGEEVPEKVEVIIPARARGELMPLLWGEEEPLELAFNAARSQVLFRMKSVEMVATLVQGTFPNYSQLIPGSYASRALIDMRQFLQECRRHWWHLWPKTIILALFALVPVIAAVWLLSALDVLDDLGIFFWAVVAAWLLYWLLRLFLNLDPQHNDNLV